MKRSNSISLSVATLLSLAVASAASAATVANDYTLLSTPVATATSPYTVPTLESFSLRSNWAINETNGLGQALIRESDPNGGGNIGQKLFLFDPAHQANGLVAIGPASVQLPSGLHLEFGSGISDLGSVTGYSLNANSNDTAWVYIPGTGTKVLGVTGDLAGNTYHSSNGTIYSQIGGSVAGAGWVTGNAARYSSTTQVGSDYWFYNPNSSADAKVIPLIDNSASSIYKAYVTVASGGTATYEQGTVSIIDDAGLILGNSFRYMNKSYASASPSSFYGRDAWIYNGAATTLATTATQIGLIQDPAATGSAYSLQSVFSATDSTILRNTTTDALSATGTIGGASSVYSTTAPVSGSTVALGTIAWLYTPGTNPGTFNFSYNSANNNSFANSSTPGTIGNAAVGMYVRVGLYNDSIHTSANGVGSSTVQAINAAGQATGISIRYSTSGTAVGSNDAWYFSGVAGSASLLILPSTSSTNFSLQYTYDNGSGDTGTVRRPTINSLNSNGWVAGTSLRYPFGTTSNSLNPAFVGNVGQDAWVYDAANNTTYVVDAAVNDTNGNFSSTIQYLSNDGIALGTYTGISGTYIFAWKQDGSATGKFITLGSVLTNDSLASANWSALASLVSIGSDGTIYGLGTTTAGTQGIFGLTPQKAADADLDGKLSIDDYLAIDTGYLESQTATWAHGDFNHDRTIDYRDYAILDAAIKAQGGSLADGEIALHTAQFGEPYLLALAQVTQAVPEPGSLVLIGTGAVALLRRRSRDRSASTSGISSWVL